MVKEHHPAITYVLPDEGGALWVDHLVVLAAAPSRKLAFEFIDVLNEPENAARLARFLYYATPNLAAERLLPAEFLQDPTIYPTPAVLQRSEAAMALSPRATRRYNRIFEELTRQDGR
jgi:spermidine/putrescine transport system substrate-binding protein